MFVDIVFKTDVAVLVVAVVDPIVAIVIGADGIVEFSEGE